jgi:hypothetical protein
MPYSCCRYFKDIYAHAIQHYEQGMEKKLLMGVAGKVLPKYLSIYHCWFAMEEGMVTLLTGWYSKFSLSLSLSLSLSVFLDICAAQQAHYPH